VAESEGELPGRRPIVAMTANVLKEAVETCIEAGMDGFLPKPFARRQMIEVLARWLGTEDRIEAGALPQASATTAVVPTEAGPDAATRATADTRQAASPKIAGPAIDALVYAQLAETMGEELSTLVDDFVSSTEGMLGALADGPQRQDVKLVTRHAHTLKSSAAMVGAMALSAQARQLEAEGKAGDLSRLDQALDHLRVEFERVRCALDAAANNTVQVADV